MKKSDEIYLVSNGWTVECESPFEISTQDGSFASGEGAYIVLEYLKTETVKPFSSEWWKEMSDEAWNMKKYEVFHYCNQRIIKKVFL